MNPSKQLYDYFTDRILAPVREWQLEAQTNREFYLGDKSYDYVVTVAGHEPAACFIPDATPGREFQTPLEKP